MNIIITYTSIPHILGKKAIAFHIFSGYTRFMTAFIQRISIEEITKHLQSKEITMLVGPRQAGKTTIMLHIKEQLDKQGEKNSSFKYRSRRSS